MGVGGVSSRPGSGPLGPPDIHPDAVGCLTALISVTASLFSNLRESHVFFASGVTRVINREDLGLGRVTCCHPHNLLFWALPFGHSVM